jgi:hypothetical protein
MRQRAAVLVMAMSVLAAGEAAGVQFTAQQVLRTEGQTRTVTVYHREGMWRLEHDRGTVGITIIREDMGLTWLLIPRVRQFIRVPIDPASMPLLDIPLKGEVSRERIGVEEREGRSVTLYEVTVERGGRQEGFYQWVADDLGVPLKLVAKSGAWSVEYRQLRSSAVPDEYFELPHRYSPAP